MSERAPVPDDEWKKFSEQNEAAVETERANIRQEAKPSLWRREGMKPDGKELTDDEIRAEVEAESHRLEKTVTPEMRRNEELLTRVESGELTYEQLDEMVLKTYQETPLSERNWKRDAGFYQLAEEERQQEVLAEAVRDTRALSETLRVAVRNPEKQRRLRDLLQEIDFELQKEFHS